MEWLEKHHYQEIMGDDVIWVRYIDDVFIVVPKSLKKEDKLKKTEHSRRQNLMNTWEGKSGIHRVSRHDDSASGSRQIQSVSKADQKGSIRSFLLWTSHSDKVMCWVALGFFWELFESLGEFIHEETEHTCELSNMIWICSSDWQQLENRNISWSDYHMSLYILSYSYIHWQKLPVAETCGIF